MARKRRVRRARKTFAKNAPRRRRRRALAVVRRAAAPARRRRRRHVAAFASNPPTRRRRRVRHHHRRRFSRNPGISTSGIVGNIVQGLKDGATVVAGQVAARKVRGAITGMLPAATQTSVKSGAGYVALSIGAAVAVSIAAKKFAPAQARMAAAGAFSEAINAALAQTPIAPYLGAFGPRRIVPVRGARAGVGAWAQPAAVAGVGAWPRVVGMPAMAGM